MNAFLTQVTQKAADRWAAALALPGVVYLAVIAATLLARRGHTLISPGPVTAQVDHWLADHPSTGTLIAALAAVAAASAGLAFAVDGAAQVIEYLWFSFGWGPPGALAADRRQRAWDRADERYGNALAARYRRQDASDGALDAALDARDRICLIRPAGPSWMADRIRATGERVHLAYGIDLVSLWPRLWLTVPDATRAELGTARAAVTRDARLFAWGLLYLVPATWWWPALAITAVTCPLAWYQARLATNALASLTESAVDLHLRDVAARLLLPADPGSYPEAGAEMTRLLRKE